MATRITEPPVTTSPIDVTHEATGVEELTYVAITFSAAPTTSENLTITLDNILGGAYDVTLLTIDPSASAATSIVWYPDNPQMLALGDEIDVVFANTDGESIGVKIVTESVFKTTVPVKRTLANIMVETAKLLGGFRSGLATGGSSTTVADTNRNEQDDYFNQGTLFVIDTIGDGAPIGEYGEIVDFVQSTGLFTINHYFNAAVGAGDRYGVIPSYSPDSLLEAINIALHGVPYEMHDSTSIDTVADQTEYELPAFIAGIDIREIRIQTISDEDNANGWELVYNWDYIAMGPGLNDLLVLPINLEEDVDIDITYISRPKPMYVWTDHIDKSIPVDRIIYRAAVWCLMERFGQGTGNETIQARINYLLERAEDADSQHQRSLPHKTPRIMIW